MGVVSHKDTKNTEKLLLIETALWPSCLCGKHLFLIKQGKTQFQ